MAARRPLVRVGGRLQQLPANDTIEGAPPTDLSVTRDSLSVTIRSSTRSGSSGDAYLPVANGAANLAGLMSGADQSKLAGIQAEATKNATDAQLRDLSTHTGSLPASQVSGLQTALDAKLARGNTVVGTAGTQLSSVQVLRDVAATGNGATPGSLLKIKLPVSWTNTMMTLKLRGRIYAVGGDFEVMIGGYNYTPGGGSWINVSAVALGTIGITAVKFGHDGDTCCIVVQFNGQASYCLAEVAEVVLGYSNHLGANWHTGWSLDFISSEAGITYTANTTIDPKAQAREGLGLGSAATKSVVTSVTDSTPDRLLISGYQGLGADSIVSDPDVFSVSRLFATSNSSNVFGISGCGIHIKYPGLNRAVQFFGSVSGASVEFQARGCSLGNDTWSPVARLWTDRNFTPANYSTTIQMQAAIVAATTGTPVTAFTSTSYTIALSYFNSGAPYLRFTSASAAVLNVPANSAVAIPIGAELTLRRAANANLTIVPASGVVVNLPPRGTYVLTQGMTVTLKKVAINEWDMIGETVLA